MAVLAEDLVGIGFAPVQAEFLANAINGAGGGGVQPVALTPLTGITGTPNDVMTGAATITNSTSTAATVVLPTDMATVKSNVDTALATANTNLLAAANQVVTKANTQFTAVNADLKDLQGKVDEIIAALAG